MRWLKISVGLLVIVVLSVMSARLVADTQYEALAALDQRAYAQGVQDGLEAAAAYIGLIRGHPEVIATLRAVDELTPDELLEELDQHIEPSMVSRIVKLIRERRRR